MNTVNKQILDQLINDCNSEIVLTEVEDLLRRMEKERVWICVKHKDFIEITNYLRQY